MAAFEQQNTTDWHCVGVAPAACCVTVACDEKVLHWCWEFHLQTTPLHREMCAVGAPPPTRKTTDYSLQPEAIVCSLIQHCFALLPMSIVWQSSLFVLQSLEHAWPATHPHCDFSTDMLIMPRLWPIHHHLQSNAIATSDRCATTIPGDSVRNESH